jgi:hypothetical protein
MPSAVILVIISDFHKRFEKAGGSIFISKSYKSNPNTMVYIDDFNGFYLACESVVNDNIFRKIENKNGKKDNRHFNCNDAVLNS